VIKQNVGLSYLSKLYELKFSTENICLEHVQGRHKTVVVDNEYECF
jgi:hypothetical protein